MKATTQSKRRIKSGPPDAFDVHVTPEGVKLISLSGDDLRYTAYAVASELKSGNYSAAFARACSFAERGDRKGIRRLLQLILDGDSARFDPTATRRRIISAYFAASPWRNGAFVVPTLAEVKAKFRELFPKAEMPSDETFKRAFRELPQLRDWRKGKGGHPRGRKNQVLLPQDKRKRRKKTRSRNGA